MVKKYYLLGVVSGILSVVASLIYQYVYKESLGADFSGIIGIPAVVGSCLTGGLVAATGYWLLEKFIKKHSEIVFNLLFTILSFASIVGAFAMKLPLTVEMPELFPGLVVPMHFFPALAWMTLKPMFVGSKS
jgi:hypothetical protein